MKQLRLFGILQDGQNPKMFPSLPASSTLCKWFCSEEAACFGSFSVFLAWWASKILILKVVGQLPMCCWKCCQVWDDPTRLFEGGGCWHGLVGNDLHLQLSSLRWEVQGQSKPCDSKALFTTECGQVTQKPERFLCKILEISFCCRQLGVFRANKQQTGHFLHCLPGANIRELQLSWDHCFCQDTCQLLLCTWIKMS